MKKILTLAILITSFFATSCNEETVDLSPIGYTEDAFFKTETDFQWAANGLYHRLANFYAFLGDPNNTLIAVSLLPSDDLTTQANYGEENFRALDGGSGRLRRFYQNSYQLIQRANTLNEYIDSVGAQVYTVHPTNSPILMNQHKGEALFFRGWAHFMLWNVFGTAPVLNKRIKQLNNEDEYPANSSGTELLTQAINDFKAAAELLPAQNSPNVSGENLGRVTKNSAYGMLGKALVFRGTVDKNVADFTEAITSFNAITGRSLTPHYNQNFDMYYENNQESLFEYQANRSLGNVNPFLPNDDFAAIGEIAAFMGNFSGQPSWAAERVYWATRSVYETYNEADPRRIYNFVNNPKFDGSAVNVRKYLYRMSAANNLPPTNAFPPGLANGNGLYINNPRILRLADVMLLKAEAIVRSGGDLTEAITIINEIRKRARESTTVNEYLFHRSPTQIVNPLPDKTEAAEPAARPLDEANPSQVLEWVYEERRMELAFEEGHRWWDLRRRHLAGEINLVNWEFQSLQTAEFQPYNVNFPLPNQDVIENRNLNQNPGY